MKTLLDNANNTTAFLDQSRRLKYYIHDFNDTARLVSEQKEGFKFEYYDPDNITKAKLYIGRVKILDEFGVFADEDIIVEPNQKVLLGYYAGEEGQAGREDENSLYIFRLVNSNNHVIGFIDARSKRNWTAFINHSQTPNVKVLQEKIDGKRRICFYAISLIKKGDQLLFDYGPDYFDAPVVRFKPLYLHSSDGLQTTEEVYSSNKHYYATEIINFDRVTCEELGFTHSQWRVPKIFLLILRNQVAELEQLLQQGFPVDLVAYACDDDGFLPTSHQQHITALLLACYLGRKEVIEMLLKFKADVNRCMLNAGFTSLIMLLKGKCKDHHLTELALKILPQTSNSHVCDIYQLNALHYAIKRNVFTLVKRLLEIAEIQNKDIFKPMFERNIEYPVFADLDYCLLNNQFQMLEIILNSIANQTVHMDGQFLKYIKRRYIFSETTFKNATQEQLAKLKHILHQKPIVTRYKNTKLFEILDINKESEIMMNVSESTEVKLNEESIHRLIEQAKKLFDQKDYQTATNILDNILKFDSQQLCALYLKGQVLEETENFNEAIMFYDKALTICPNDASLLYNKALCISWSSHPQAEEKTLELLSTIDPSFEDVEYYTFVIKSSLLIKKKEYAKALQLAMETLNNHQNDEKLLSILAQCHFGLENYPQALDISQQLLQENPNSVVYLSNVAKCFKALKKYPKALEVYQKIYELEPNNDAIKKEISLLQNRFGFSRELLAAGVLDFYCRRYADVIEKLSKIKSTSAYYIDALIYKGRALAKLQDYEQAISNFELAFQMDQKNYLVLLDIALSHHANAKYEDATKFYDLLLAKKNNLDPQIVEAVEGKNSCMGYKQIAVKLAKRCQKQRNHGQNSKSEEIKLPDTSKDISAVVETTGKTAEKFFPVIRKNNKRKKSPDNTATSESKRFKKV